MRVLFTAHGAYGHVLPLVALASALRDAGHEVRVAVGRDMRPVAASLGLETIAAGLDDEALVAEARRRWPEATRQPPVKWAVRMFTDIAAPAMAGDLLDVLGSWRPDLIVREEGEYAAPIVAERHGIAWITHGWGSPLPPREQLEQLPELLAPLARRHGLRPPQDPTRLYGQAVLDPCPSSLYVNAPAAQLQPIRPVPPEVPVETGEEPAPTQPFAYISFGTVPLYRNRPAALLACTRAVLAAGMAVVVTASDPVLAEQLRGLDPTRITAREWVSLPRLLPSCSLVVSHGGAGTVLAALGHGVPQLLLPRGAPSQLRMTAACAARGVARGLHPDQADAAAITEAIRDLVSNPTYARAAGEVAAEIAKVPHPREVARGLGGGEGA